MRIALIQRNSRPGVYFAACNPSGRILQQASGTGGEILVADLDRGQVFEARLK